MLIDLTKTGNVSLVYLCSPVKNREPGAVESAAAKVSEAQSPECAEIDEGKEAALKQAA